MTARAALAGVVLLLGACAPLATAPPPALPALPARWSGDPDRPAGPVALATWWARFDDPQLSGLVARSLQANAGLAGAEAALRQARALSDLAAAAAWPTLGGSASVSRSRSDGFNDNHWQAGLAADWVPDAFGARRSARRAADAAAEASRAGAGALQVQLAAEVALDYLSLRDAQARLAIADDNLASQLDTLQITRWRRQAGLVTVLETEQARAAAEQTRALGPALRTRIALMQHALAVLAGQAPGDDSTRALDLAEVRALPQALDAPALGVPADTLRQRADVRAAEFQVLAARSRVDQAEAARWPSLSLGGTLGLGAATLGSLTSGATVASSLLAGLSAPLLDGGAARAQVRAQQAALDQAHASYRGTLLAALQDVQDALAALQGDRERLASLRVAAASAVEAATLARQRYDSGLADFQTVLETQRTRLGTQDAVAASLADVGADQVRLFTALGGGWPADPIDAADRRAATALPR